MGKTIYFIKYHESFVDPEELINIFELLAEEYELYFIEDEFCPGKYTVGVEELQRLIEDEEVRDELGEERVKVIEDFLQEVHEFYGKEVSFVDIEVDYD